MNAALWHASIDPRSMLDHLLDNRLIDNRKLQLWCAALFAESKANYGNWYGRISAWMVGAKADSESSQSPTLTALSWADPHPTRDRLGDPPMAFRAAALRDLVGDPWTIIERQHRHRDGSPIWSRKRSAGPGHHILTIHDDWLTPLVVNLAQAAFDGVTAGTRLDPVRLLVLADAMEEAGCPVEVPCECALTMPRGPGGQTMPTCQRCPDGFGPHPLLAHLRSPGPHFRGCWAVDLVLGKG